MHGTIWFHTMISCRFHSLQKLKTQVLIPNSLEGSTPIFRFYCIVFRFPVQIKSNPVVFKLFPESDMQVERKFEILGISNFCFSFHTFPCMESYGSMHFHVWNHMVPCMELYGIILIIHGIACKPYEFGSGIIQISTAF